MKIPDHPELYPFTLNFDGVYAHIPFIFDKTPVTLIGKNTAPSGLISARAAGDMSFCLTSLNKKRDMFFRSMGIPPEKVYSLFQIHSRDVFTLGEPAAQTPAALPHPDVFARQGDGMVSFSSAAVLAVTVADCLPVFLLDTEKGYWSLLHSGWKGTGIVLKALAIMQKAGTRPEAIAAVLGPCIQDCCYQVDEERSKMFEAEFGAASPYVQSFDKYPLGKVIRHDAFGWYISLQAANARLLAAAGVRHIAYCTDCTFTDERLGSFRREGSQSYTHMIALAGYF